MGECNYEIPGLPYPAFRMWNAEAGMVATVSEFLTVGSSHTCIPNSMRLLLAAGSRFGREEPAVRKALTAATSYPAFRKMNAEAAGRRAVPLLRTVLRISGSTWFLSPLRGLGRGGGRFSHGAKTSGQVASWATIFRPSVDGLVCWASRLEIVLDIGYWIS